MDESERAYRSALGMRIAALTRAKAELQAGTPGAAGSVRRLSLALRASAATGVHVEVEKAAAAVINGADRSLLKNSEKLLAALRSSAGTAAPESEQSVVLVVEDDPVSGELIRRLVATPARHVVIAPTLADAESCLEGGTVALVILDLVLPDGDGRNLLMRLKENSRVASIPTIVVSALHSAQVRTECYALGCDAYVEKPVEGDVLAAAANSLLERAARSVRAGQRDDLTGLPNRAGVTAAFDKLTAGRGQGTLVVGMLDLDGFRVVNERLGSGGGDGVIRAFGDFARSQIGEWDVLGRWGGEEFVFLFPDTDAETAGGALRTLLEKLRNHSLAPATPDLRLTFTAGVVATPAGSTLDEAVAEADRLLLEGKASGRNAVVTAHSISTPAVRTVLVAEDDPVIAALVRHRLSRDGFDVVHASNGIDALARAEEGNLALAILDVNMPGLSGFDLLTQLRQRPAFDRTPIMMLTAMGNEADIARALALGANDYVVKPFSPVELLARVRRLAART